ncbi:hypothetical protein D9V84_10235 [Bacteroidetes/Chlorobi group bacterium Naka2016]|nr:MAG: hypothetical protein D9V84_10235 [Bacteroidetes/Chlorobi group bacterium Naka2016]
MKMIFVNKKSKKNTNVKMLIILMMLIVQNLRLYSSDFDLTPMNIHFFGATVFNDKIFVYGSNGSYLLSTDFGKSWQQYSLLPYGNIFHITSYKDTLWSVLDCGIVAWSTDGGFTWSKKEFQLSNNELMYYILPTEACFFVRTNYGIYKLNKDLNITNVLKDSILYIKNDNIYDFLNLPIPTFKWMKYYYSFNEIYLFKNRILLLSTNYPGLIVVDYDLTKLDTLPMQDHIYLIGEIDRITDVYLLNDFIVLNANSNLYITEDVYSKWNYFFPDTSFLNPNDPNRWNKWPITKYPDNFFFWNNKVFIEMQEASDGKYIPSGRSINDFGISPIKLYFKEFIKDESGKFCDFVKFRNHFNDRSIAFVPGIFFPRLNATKYILTKRKAFVGDSIVIIPGLFKTIIQSRDGCYNWDLASCNAAYFPELILNDSTFIFFNRLPYYNNTSISFDGGITFQPTELLLDTLYRRIAEVDSLGNIKHIVYENYDTVTFFAIFKKASAFFIDSSGRGFFIGTDDDFRGYRLLNFANTINFGKHFKFDSSLKIKTYSRQFLPPKVEMLDGKYIFPLIDYEYPDKWYHTKIYFLDTSFKKVDKIITPEFQMVNQVFPINHNHFILFSFLSDTIDPKNLRTFQIRESFDSGKTSTVLFSFDERLDLTQYYVHNKDSIFFVVSNPPRLFLFEVKSKSLKLLYEDSVVENILLMVISDRFFIVGRGLFLENTDRNDLTQWREGEWDYGKPNFESVIFKGNVAIAGLSDSLRPFNYYKITLKKGTPTTVESEVEKRYYTTKFWASEPYPQPAGVRVKARIAWDGSFDVAEAIDGVYDSMGRKVEGKERIRVTLRDKGYGELEWECSGVPAGVYFILLHWAGGSESVPVVVE